MIARSDALSVFVEVAEAGSFAAAAAHLGMSPAAVGQAVQRLEAHYRVKLFNRTTRRMALTPAGMLLLGRCRPLLAGLGELERLFEEESGIIAGPIRISAPTLIARELLTPIIVDFARRHEGVRFEVDASDTLRDLVRDPVDLAIRLDDPRDSSLITRPLRSLRSVVAAAPAYLEKRGTPKHPQDLPRHSCIAYRNPTSGAVFDWLFEIDGRIERAAVEPVMVFTDPEAQCAAAAQGMGLTQTLDLYARRLLADGQLVEVMPAYAFEARSLYVCYPSRDHQPLRIRRFVDFFVEQIRNPPPTRL